MNNLQITNNEVTMTSLEVVELINRFREEEGNTTIKEHKTLMRDIRSEIENLEKANIKVENNFVPYSYKAENGKTNPCFKMNKAGIMQMLNKESALVRYKTQQYIEVLENKIKEQQPKLPSTYKEALKQLLLQVEENERLEAENSEMKPKVEYHDNVLHSPKLITTTDIAKDLGISARKLNSILNDLGVIYKQGKVWHLYAEHQDKIPEYCDYHINEFTQTLKWTEKGRKFIIDLLKDKIGLDILK